MPTRIPYYDHETYCYYWIIIYQDEFGNVFARREDDNDDSVKYQIMGRNGNLEGKVLNV